MKPLPLPRRRMMPPTPLQNSNDTFEEEQGLLGAEDQRWSAKERTIIARTKLVLERSFSVTVEEDLLGPDDVDVAFRRILKEARNERGYDVFETFSTDGLSEFLVPIGRDGTSTKENGTHHGDIIRRHCM